MQKIKTHTVMLIEITIVVVISLFLVVLYYKEKKIVIYNFNYFQNIMTYSPNKIADYFLSKYGKENGITPMKLIKLVYIAHGWYLGITGNKLINENPEAWKYGPVINSLYHEYKHFGNNPITKIISENPKFDDIEDEKFLDKIWEVYGKYSGTELSAKTHQLNTPWYKVWESAKNNNNLFIQIPDEYIKEHYESMLNKNKK